MKSDAWLDEWLLSIAKGQANMRAADWNPLNIWQLEPYVGDFWVEKWLKAAEKIEKEKIPLKKLSHTVNPSLWRKELRFLMWNAKTWGYAKKERMKLAEFLKNMIFEIYTEDHFGLKSNKALAKDELEEALSRKYNKATPELAKEIGKLSSSCPHLSWSLFTDFYYSNSYDMFGMYDAGGKFGKGSSFILKKFGPYKCESLWRESGKCKYNEVEIYAIYRNLKGHFDIINHFISSDNMAAKLTDCLVYVDGKEISDIGKLKEITLYFAEQAAEQFERLSDLTFEELKAKCVEAKWFQFHKFFEMIGEDWKPPKEGLERFAGKELIQYKYPTFEKTEDGVAFWERIADPRLGFDNELDEFWNRWRKQYERA